MSRMKAGADSRILTQPYHFTLKQRLNALSFISSLALVIVGAIGLYQTQILLKKYEPITASYLPTTRALGALLSQFRQLRFDVGSIAIRGISVGQLREYIESSQGAVSEFEKSLAEVEKFLEVSQQREIYSKLKLSWADFKEQESESLRLAGTSDERLLDDTTRFNRELSDEKAKRVDAAINELIKTQTELENQAVEAVTADSHRATQVMFFSSIVMAVGFLIFCFTVIAKISGRLRESTSRVESASAGVGAVGHQVLDASQDVIRAAEQQLAAIHQASVALEKFSATVRRSADKSNEIQMTAAQSIEYVETGKQAIDRLIEAINSLKESNQISTSYLNESIEKGTRILNGMDEVAAKTRIMNDIVFQTKLLSVNASVEAARAGEQGKGFAVVAEEFGKLARMASRAVQEVHSLLTSSAKQIGEKVDEDRLFGEKMAQNSNCLLERVMTVTEECQIALGLIVRASSKLGDRVRDVTRFSDESAQGMIEMTRALQVIDESSRLTAQCGESSQLAAHKLSDELNRFQGFTSDLSLLTDEHKLCVQEISSVSAQFSNLGTEKQSA